MGEENIESYPKAGMAIVVLLISLGAILVLSIFVGIFLITVPVISLPSLGELADPEGLTEFIPSLYDIVFSPQFLISFEVICFGIWPFVFLRSRRKNLKGILRMNWNPKFLLIGILSGVAISLAVLGLWWTIAQITSQNHGVSLQNEALIANYSGWKFPLGILSLGVVTGFCEEILFRGFVMRGFENSFKSKFLAIFLSSLLFTVVHLSLMGGFALFILAMIMGFLVIKTDSIYTSMGCHAAYNSVVLVAAIFGLF
jgi:CAAX amino terminal protease family.